MIIASIAVALSVVPVAAAQTIRVDHLTQRQLIDKAMELNAKALGSDGAASAKLDDYSNHFTMISLRHKDGGAEIHEEFADFFLVVRGHATLLTGGTVLNGKTVSPGEIRGTSLQDGTRTALGQGDIVHIPATLSHQLLVPQGGTFIYFVIKVKEMR